MAEKEKKRKRHEDVGGRPSKKTATAQPTGTVRVEMLENKDVLGPVLGTRETYSKAAGFRTLTIVQLQLQVFNFLQRYPSNLINRAKSFLAVRPTIYSSNPLNTHGSTTLLLRSAMALQNHCSRTTLAYLTRLQRSSRSFPSRNSPFEVRCAARWMS